MNPLPTLPDDALIPDNTILPVTPGRRTELLITGAHDPDEQRKFRHIELEINTACDLACFACDRFSDTTNSPNMTLAQVRLFVQESLALRWQWDRIRILGGEPTLHPQLCEIVEELIKYRYFYPKCFIQLLSNGRGKLAHHREWLIYRGVDPHIEGKQPGVTPSWFNNTRIAPIDRNPSIGEVPPCGIFGVYGCGIGLTRHGYFLDGAGASVARVSGLNVGVMHLANVTWQAMMEQAKVLCRLCGHWNPDDHLETKKVTETGEVTGNYWKQAIATYKDKAKSLSVYGES